MTSIKIAGAARPAYPDVYTPDALAALEALSPLDDRRQELMAERIARRAQRARDRHPMDSGHGPGDETTLEHRIRAA